MYALGRIALSSISLSCLIGTGCVLPDWPPPWAADDDDTSAVDDDDTVPADDAQVLVAAFPETLACGHIAMATVEVRNTGSATWDADWDAGYSLGAMYDSDPLYDNGVRVYMDDGTLVFPGGNYLFEIELEAPTVAGRYLTDWQMVHAAVAWFGETAEAYVDVICGDDDDSSR